MTGLWVAVLLQTFTPQPLQQPILHPGEEFWVSAVRPGGFAGGVRAQPVRRVELLSGPAVEGDAVRWRARATGGPCEVAVQAEDPLDAVLLSYPVWLDSELARVLHRGRCEVRFVETTHGLGVEVWARGRLAGSVAPLVLLQGNGEGAPPRLARFQATYSYVGQQEDPPRAHFYGEMLGMWRAHLECRLLADRLALSLTVTPRYSCYLDLVLAGERRDARRHALRKGEVFRGEYSLSLPGR
jgi:hypothetical protein